MSIVTQRRVVIVDDSRTAQAMLDHAFSARPDFIVVGYADDAASGAEAVRRLKPDIVTIDLCMPYLDGGALLGMISDLTSVCKVIVSDRSLSNLFLTSKLEEAGASLCIGKSEVVTNRDRFFDRINSAADTVNRAFTRGNIQISRFNDKSVGFFVHSPPSKPLFPFPIPADENARLEFLKSAGLANSEHERQFDLVTKYVARMTAFPACLLTVIDRNRQWVKSSYGLEISSTPRHQAFCNYTISQGGLFTVTNAERDPRFSANELVTGHPHIRSYAGHAIVNKDGTKVAALCVIDTRARAISQSTIDQLAGMAEIIGELIDQRSALAA